MKRTISFFLLAMLAGGSLLYAYQNSKVLVLKSGQTIPIDGDYTIEGSNVYFKLGDGNTTLLPLDKVDMPATQTRNQAIATGKTTAKEMVKKNSNFREVKGRDYQGLSTVVSPETQEQNGYSDRGDGKYNGRKRGVYEDGVVSTDYLRRAFRDAPPSMQPTLQQIEQRFESRTFAALLILAVLIFFLSTLINLGFYFYLMSTAVMEHWFWGMFMIIGFLVGLTSYLGWSIGIFANSLVYFMATGYILVHCPGRRLNFIALLNLPIFGFILGLLTVTLGLMVTG